MDEMFKEFEFNEKPDQMVSSVNGLDLPEDYLFTRYVFFILGLYLVKYHIVAAKRSELVVCAMLRKRALLFWENKHSIPYNWVLSCRKRSSALFKNNC